MNNIADTSISKGILQEIGKDLYEISYRGHIFYFEGNSMDGK